MHVRRLIHGKYSPYIISIVLGIGLSCMFRKVCKERNCLIYQAPNFSKIQGKTYKYNGKCYTFHHNATHCDKKKQILEFA